MNFSPIDGGIVGLYLVTTMVAGIWVRRYVGKVEHYLVAGREMNLYLGIASLAATEFGIVTCMYTAQNGYLYGFAGAWPGIAMALAMVVVGWTGFCIKPLRDARVMTIPELLEKQFGSRVRWLAGVVIVLGGLLNMGVFLRMGGDFLIAVTHTQPEGASFLAAHLLEITMTVLLVCVALYTVLGGMLSVLVTDYLQFIVMSLGLLAVTVFILMTIGWETISASVAARHGAGGFNPWVNPDLGPAFVIFMLIHNLAVVLTWQTIIQRLLSAKDTSTGRKVYTRTSFFFVCRFVIPGLWGAAALAWLAPDINVGDKGILAMPTLLGEIVPVGLLGILVAAMLAADMSTDSAYMLTWGSVIYNDILAPLRRRRAWSERRGLLVNRTIVALIGAFLLFYGLWYEFEGDVWTYLAVTGTIYLASMSVLLVACCYWKRANSWGAMAALIAGAVVPCLFLVLEKMEWSKPWAEGKGNFFGLTTYAVVILAMVVGSWLKVALSNKEAR
ncbi:sodium:solute symporter family protein [bacterium]|nr:sodium:solute symporter family protein [bacterium]